MKCYEYKTIAAIPAMFHSLNELGDDGWEMVCVSEGIIYLKRELVK
jgi:hypothetical protein